MKKKNLIYPKNFFESEDDEEGHATGVINEGEEKIHPNIEEVGRNLNCQQSNNRITTLKTEGD